MNIGKERKVLFSVRNFLIVLALSVHSIFEGMAGILGCVLLTCGFAFMAALEAAGKFVNISC